MFHTQRTIKDTISFSGKGLHTGKKSNISIHPAPEETGIVFHSIDKFGKNSKILAHWKNTMRLPLCTTIVSPQGVYIRTIEHLMAAFYACGIDNAIVKVKGKELPILDGSAAPYVKSIVDVGTVVQKKPRKIFKVNRKIEIDEGERHIIFEPAKTLSIEITIIPKNMGKQRWSGEITPDYFKNNLSHARTFGHYQDGLLAQLSRFTRTPVCLGANKKTVIILNKKNEVINKEGLRMPDELIKHRILDLMGDLLLSGGHVQGKITTLGPTHWLTHKLLKKSFFENAISELD